MPRGNARGPSGIYYDAKRDRWEVDFRYRNVRYRGTAQTSEAAWELRQQLRSKAKLGIKARAPTLREFVENEWLPSLDLRPKTVAAYRSHIAHVVDALGSTPVDEITPVDLRKVWQSLRVLKVKRGKAERTLSPRTIAHIRAITRNALRRAEQDGYVSRNVAALTDAPKVPNTERRTLSMSEARAFLASLEGDRMEPLYVVTMTLGLRQSELLGLRWGDIEAGRESRARVEDPRLTDDGARMHPSPAAQTVLHVRQTLQRTAGKPTLLPPKTPRAQRAIPLPQVIVDYLNRWRAQQKAEFVSSGARPTHDLIFTTKTGNPVTSSTLLRDLYRRLDALEIERVRFHDLRHLAASMLVSRGLSPRETMAVLGHANFNTSMSVYAHADAEELAQKMSEVRW